MFRNDNGQSEIQLNLPEWRSLFDSSTLSLIASNSFVIAWALIAKWDVKLLMWCYWGQSVIFGFFWALRISTYKEVYGKVSRGSAETVLFRLDQKYLMAAFFLLHYEGFHIRYFLFLNARVFGSKEVQLPLITFAVFAVIFFIQQLASFIRHLKTYNPKPVSFAKLTFFPYARIIPMHITIVFGGEVIAKGYDGQLILALFLFLKMVADVGMHIIMQKGFDYEPGSNKLRIVKGLLDDKCILPTGETISLEGRPELADKLKAVENLPAGIRAEVYQRYLAKEGLVSYQENDEPGGLDEAQPSLDTCCCDEIDTVKGSRALKYAQSHMKLLGRTASDTVSHYICPNTNKRWVFKSNILRELKLN